MSKENIDNLKSTFQFKRPVLKGIFFLPNVQYKGNKKTTSLNFSTQLVEVDPQKEAENGYQNGKVELEVSNFNSESEAELNKNPYLLSIVMQAEFLWPESWSKEVVKKFIKVNAASLLFSYIRPIISNITGMSEFEREDLPFIDFSKGNDK
ncbi:hypothetical protein EFS28_03460 [Lactobacillus acidophilus]|uniref:protein-export chaperone SecB n=1 Tax=Lactobacillus acidophilus TaxID=1579 RepID=UPI0021A741CA|nr:protein-export chaperone SecB [Lactobacillus acidophilus]MCT3602848.1 hypothetical protein [Lactobacillus acidophilus]MCT3623308.1 hypothetical protein [Lactobacillus acidophilus]